MKDYALPLFNEVMCRSPKLLPAMKSQRWNRKWVDRWLYLLNAEYTYGIFGGLKNALDIIFSISSTANRRPSLAMAVSAAPMLLSSSAFAIELQLAPLKNGMHIGTTE